MVHGIIRESLILDFWDQPMQGVEEALSEWSPEWMNKACPWLRCQWSTINWQSHYPSGSVKALLKVWVCVFMNHWPVCAMPSDCSFLFSSLGLFTCREPYRDSLVPTPHTVHSKCPEAPGCQWLENLCSTLAPALLYLYLCVCLFFISLLPLARVQRPKPLRTWTNLFAIRAF